MEITHYIESSVQNIVADTVGFDIVIACNDYMLDNNGQDDVKIYFNGDLNNYAIVKSGASLRIGIDYLNELINDKLKVEFLTIVSPMLNIVKQTKKLII